MDRGLSTGTHLGDDGLRERNPTSQSQSPLGTGALTAAGEVEAKDSANKDKKTFGRTPDGTGRDCPKLCVEPGW